jgi:hypothetical protein
MFNGRKRAAHTSARALGWFSVGVGLAELLAPKLVARLIGLPGREGVLQAYGLREIITGIGILSSVRPASWVRFRLAGDALDVASLGAGMMNSSSKVCTLGAIGAVSAVTLADAATAQVLGELEQKERTTYPDYSARSGFAQSPESLRGAAISLQEADVVPNQERLTGVVPVPQPGLH